mmetsp:Transcript_17338/g.23358  ORF Transcript_17338/g.23358 Transcript_17338/m.23358 type:complete len:80 (+) Transcript_17338:94-333(+)
MILSMMKSQIRSTLALPKAIRSALHFHHKRGRDTDAIIQRFNFRTKKLLNLPVLSSPKGELNHVVKEEVSLCASKLTDL